MKNYSSVRKGKSVRKNLSQRWLGSVLLNAESGFRKVKGFGDIPEVITNIRKSRQALDSNVGKAA